MNAGLGLAAVLAVTMSTVFVMPDFREAESALNLSLDERVGEWHIQQRPPAEKVVAILAKDTDFANATCVLPRTEQRSAITGEMPLDVADLSIVLSGYDLATSIHRPERCLPAQGHRIIRSETDVLQLANGRSIPVTRLTTKRTLTTGTPEAPEHVTQNCLVYYFFVGRQTITASHVERTLVDIRDRLLRGEAQRWAYVSAIMPFDGEDDGGWWAPLSRGQADKKIRQLLAELAEDNIDWSTVAP